MMWHEIRKQERKIRCMIVDYKKRAERRKDYYEKIKADPTQFIQLHGRQAKIHLDPAVAAAGDSSAVMMNWAGAPEIVIDRFDVRAHLDYISDKGHEEEDKQLSYDERHINYERYRILVQNDFLGVSEEKFLHQLHLEEQYGASTKTGFVANEGKKKVVGAAIGYVYEDSTGDGVGEHGSCSKDNEEQDENEEEDDSDVDFDVVVDVNKVSMPQAHELNNASLVYGMEGNDFFSFLTKDKEEAENLRLAKELEEEKAMFSGRRSRRERRAYREKMLAGRKISPPSYASKKSPNSQDYKQLRNTSHSRSPSPENAGQITFITSFGGEENQSADPTPSTFRRNTDTKTKLGRRSPEKQASHHWRHRSPERSGHRRRSSPPRARHSSPRRRKSPRRQHADQPLRHRSPVVQTPPHNLNSLQFQTNLPNENSSQKTTAVSRYYGRKRGDSSSSSELSWSEDDEDPSNKVPNKASSEKTSLTDMGNAGGRTKSASGSGGQTAQRLTQQERLKRKMQIMLNRQFKADKRAEREKKERVQQERMDREDEMRELSIKLRKRERMKRHEQYAEMEKQSRRSSRSSSIGSSRSRSRSPRHRRERRRKSRSKSRSRSKEHQQSSRGLVDY